MTSGEKILTLVRSTQRLHAEIAALLKTFEKLSIDRGFLNRKNKSVSNGCSDSIDSPEVWMTPWMFRHLQNKNDPDDILILNVILAPDDEVAGRRDFKEPLVLCGRFRYNKGKAKGYEKDWDPHDLWFYGPEKKMDRPYSVQELELESKEFQSEAGWEGVWKALKDVRFLAMPLASMVDSKTLERSVIQRILTNP